jgi:predicted RecA/RadA family phage recombinase
MATNFVCNGETLTYANAGAAIASGAPLLVGVRLGVALGDIAATSGTGEVAVSGVFAVRKVTGAITQGALLYWDADANPVEGTAGSGALTTTATDNTLAGFAYAAAASGAATVQIKLNA